MAPSRTKLRPARTPVGTQSIRAPLAPTEVAFVQLVLEEHAGLIRAADQRRDQRMAVLLHEKGIPDGVHVTIDNDALVYTPPVPPA